jgi:chorismate mutase
MEEKGKAKIQSLRQRIGAVDDEILQLLNHRAEIVQEVGKVKTEMKMTYYNLWRRK